MFCHKLSLWNIPYQACLGFPALALSPLGDHLKIASRCFLVAVNSTNFQSDHFALVTVQCLRGDVAELQAFCCSETCFFC